MRPGPGRAHACAPRARALCSRARVRAGDAAEAPARARQLAFHELAALYAITDVALVTSLRDGMNLVSYEYVACQSDNAGARPGPCARLGWSPPWCRPPLAWQCAQCTNSGSAGMRMGGWHSPLSRAGLQPSHGRKSLHYTSYNRRLRNELGAASSVHLRRVICLCTALSGSPEQPSVHATWD